MKNHTLSRRQVLLALPALVIAPKAWTQATAKAPLAAKSFNHFMLSVSDVQRSLQFYQGLLGMPVQARHGSTVLLRVGSGPQYIGLTPAGDNPPSISHCGLAIEDFDAARAMQALAANGVTKAADSDPGLAGGPMKVRQTMRGNTPEIFLGDPDGLVVQLQDASYCGGTGAKGAVCKAEPSPKKGLLAVKDMNHATIQISDSQKTVDFYQALFGIKVQGYQAPAGSSTAPFYGIGEGNQFVMFLGAPRREGAPARPARIDHLCMSMDGFNPEAVTKTLNSYGLKSQGQGEPRGPMMTYTTLRMPNRGGAEAGTPELYFIDPDGLSIQLQDTTYCGGSGFLGETCPAI